MTYTSPIAFDAAAGPLTTITFPSTSPSLIVDPSYAADGVTFTGSTESGAGIYYISPSYYFEYDRDGSNAASLDSYDTNPGFAPTTIQLPVNTYAIGFEWFTVVNSQPTVAASDTIQIGPNAYTIDSLPWNGEENGSDLAFFGATSTTPIASITLTPLVYLETGTDIEEFQFSGSLATQTPEPATLGVTAALLIALAVGRFRRRAKVTD